MWHPRKNFVWFRRHAAKYRNAKRISSVTAGEWLPRCRPERETVQVPSENKKAGGELPRLLPLPLLISELPKCVSWLRSCSGLSSRRFLKLSLVPRGDDV